MAKLATPRRHDLYIAAAVALLLALFIGFGGYALHFTARLRGEQRQALQRTEADTQQLLRAQQDTYQLAELVRDMVLTAPGAAAGQQQRRGGRLAPLPQPPLAIWGVEFHRLRLDLEQALAAEARWAPAGRGTAARARLGRELAQFWSISDQAFRLARLGYGQPARDLVERELMPQRRVVNRMMAGWLAQNRRAQADAEAAAAARAARLARGFLLLTLALIGLGLAFSLWAIRSNRRAFARVEELARELQSANARLLAVQEETLARLTRDLHDAFGQLLVAMQANLARAAALLEAPRSAAPEAVAEVARARAAVSEAQAKMRDLAQALRPALLDDFGVERALAHAVRQFARQTGLEATFAAQGAIPPLDGERAIHLYRIAQEALTNAARHGAAKRVRVALRARSGRLELEIADDGRGFDPLHSDGGSGLAGIRQRALALGGWLEIERGAETVVRATVPMQTRQPPGIH